MKKYQTAKELLATKAENKEKKPIYATRKLSIGLVSCMLGLVMATPMVFAEGEGTKATQTVEENTEQVGGTKDQNPETKETPVIIENDNPAQVDNEGGLEIGPEIASDRVTAAVKAPTVNDVLYDATTISGANLAKAKVNKENVIATVHVTLKGKDGTVKATLKVTPKSGTKWKVDLPEGVKVEEGDTVTVYQQIGEDKSPEVTKTAQAPKASSVTLKMPTGEIWIEQTSSNIVNDDEQAEAVQKLKDANAAIADDIESVKFSIDGTEHAYYEVTYKDNSTTGKVEAPNLTVKQVTETSRSPEIDSITVVDNVIKGKLAGPGPFDKIKVQLIVKVKKEKAGNFCTDKGCKFDKDSSTPVEVTLQNDGTFSYTLQERESLTLDQIVGVSVKEPHKFVSCSTTTVKPAPIEKTEVKDPRKLTAEDKKAIDAAIRKGYTVNGESKLPNGTASGMEGIPAVIQIDDSGNVKIFSGNDVKGTWDSNYNFVPEKNDDGSYKLKDGAQPKITIEGKDLLKNIKPDAPAVALSGDKKNITITPKEVDTDANSISVSYTGKDGKTKTTTATKADDGTWSIAGEGTVVNGVITLPKDKVKGGTDVTATVTDKGGIADDDKDPLTSDPGKLTVEETIADKVEALGGLDPVDIKKWVGDTIDWKKGVKVKDSATAENKAKIKEILDKGTTKFTDETTQGRSTGAQGDFKGTIKVAFDDGSFIEVKNQNLYVSNHVTSMDRKDKVPEDALDVEFKLGEGVKVTNTDGSTKEGDKTDPVSYSKYKVKRGTNLKTYKLPSIDSSVVDSITLQAKDKYEKPAWNDNGQAVTDFTVNANKVFIATAKSTSTGGTTTPGAGSGTGTTPDPTPNPTPDPSQPDNTPGTTPGSENPTKDNPTDPAKNNPDPKDKPEDKKPGENKNEPKKPNLEKGDKVINVGGTEVVVPEVKVDKKKGKLDKEERTKIAEKIKEKNPDVVDVKIDENANAYVTFNDGRRERIPAKDLLSKEGFMIPRRDRHSQDESPNRRRAGKNVKTGVESIAGIACTLVASTGALYIGRKKED